MVKMTEILTNKTEMTGLTDITALIVMTDNSYIIYWNNDWKTNWN